MSNELNFYKYKNIKLFYNSIREMSKQLKSYMHKKLF